MKESVQLPEFYPGWRTVDKIGTGSYGTVYEIERELLGGKERSALKHISIPLHDGEVEEMYGNGYDRSSILGFYEQCLKQFVQEYALMVKMKGHTNVVCCDDIYYLPKESGFGWDIYIKMELLTSLTQSLGPEISEEQVIRLGTDLCQALALCRKYSIVHRDIKPQNIFVSESGDYKLGDFGIAKTAERTSGGTKVGTYNYMAPEVYHNRPYGAAADIYSLGLVMYWMLNDRRLPFQPLPPAVPSHEQMEKARYRRFSGERLPLPAHGSEALQAIVLKACAFDPRDRYASAEEMLEALNCLKKGVTVPPPPPKKTKRRVTDTKNSGKSAWNRKAAVGCALGALMLLVIGFFTIHIWRPASCTEPPVCRICGKRGDASQGHDWTAATCTEPAVCRICGEILRAPLGHDWTAATCTEPITCLTCRETRGEPRGHDWMAATYESPVQCAVCRISEGETLTEQIISEATRYAEEGQYRYAIQKLDGAWKESGRQEFFELAADYRMAFGMHASTILAAGKKNSMIRYENGTVDIVGDNEFGELDADNWTGIVAIGMGDVHTIGLRSDGRVVLVSTYDSGLLGHKDYKKWENVVAISAGDMHSVALLKNGTVVSDGYQCQRRCDTDALMSRAGRHRIVAISAGFHQTLALLDNGTVVADGVDLNHACDVEYWTDIAAIVTGTEFSAGLRTDGTVVITESAWDVSGWKDMIALAAGDYFLLGLCADGSVYSVGGEGKPDVSHWHDIVCIAAGNNHAVAIDSQGYLHNAGSNADNQYFDAYTNINNHP